MTSADRLEPIRTIAERVARSYGLEIFDVQLRRERGGWTLRVVIDRPAPPGGAPEDSVSIQDCERVSHDLGAIFDVEDPLDRAYTLEISSPGLDRPLRDAGDYRRFSGRLAKIVASEPIEGQTHFEGRLKGIEADIVLLEQGRRVHRIPLARIARGRLEVEF